MESFDKIIKEKVEEKQYRYKPSAWKSFAKFSGFSVPYSGMKIALISIVSVSVLSIGAFFLYRSLVSDTKPIENAGESAIEHVIPADTLTKENVAPEEIIPETKVRTTLPVKKETKIEVNTSVTETKQPDTPAVKPPVTKPIEVKKPQNTRRILIINPDTIKSNY